MGTFDQAERDDIEYGYRHGWEKNSSKLPEYDPALDSWQE